MSSNNMVHSLCSTKRVYNNKYTSYLNAWRHNNNNFNNGKIARHQVGPQYVMMTI